MRAGMFYLQYLSWILYVTPVMMVTGGSSDVTTQSVQEGSFRLVNGTRDKSGRLEVFLNGRWGTVCHKDIFYTEAVSLICKYFGFTTGGIPRLPYYYGEGIGPIWMGDVECHNKRQLSDCTYTSAHDCTHSQDMGVYCFSEDEREEQKEENDKAQNSTNVGEPGDVRVVGGLSQQEGRVEIYLENRWGNICDGDLTDADIICKQLGYGRALWYHHGAYDNPDVPHRPRFYHTERMRCEGNETAITQCPGTMRYIHEDNLKTEAECPQGSYCNPGYAQCYFQGGLEVECGNESFPVPGMQPGNEGDVRLVNGPTHYSGRVELYHNGIWGTVCGDDYGFTEEFAAAVCWRLGYKGGRTKYMAYYGPGQGTIWQLTSRNMNCALGFNISRCIRGSLRNQYCWHTEDKGVECKVPGADTYGSDADGELRLVGGESPEEGRLEVYHKGVWGSVCAVGFDVAAARTVCTQMSLTGGSLASYGQNSGTIWLSQVRCGYNSMHLQRDCVRQWGNHQCTHAEDVGVKCEIPDNSVEDWSVRLVNGPSDLEGHLQTYHLGKWGNVCRDYSFTNTEAKVACKQLGYIGGEVVNTNLETWVEAAGRQDRFWMRQVTCSGDEAALHLCDYTQQDLSRCARQVAAVKCWSSTSDAERTQDLRIVRGPDQYTGFLEFRYQGSWRPVCGAWFYQSTNAVVCRQMGYVEKAGRYWDMYDFRQKVNVSEERNISLDYISCQGDETHIRDCEVTTGQPFWCRGDYGMREEAYVHCAQYESGNEEGNLKLTYPQSNGHSRLHVFHQEAWGVVCNDGFDDTAASVACRQMGRQRGTVYTGIKQAKFWSYGSRETNPSFEAGPIWLDDISCHGNEENLVSCDHNDWGVNDCTHKENVWIKCFD